MFLKLVICTATILQASADHAMPSSLLQISSESTSGAAPSIEGFLSTMRKDVDAFQKKMDAEARADEEQVRKMREQQRKLEREEKAFKAKVFAHHKPEKSPSSFIESSTHFGDPYIDEAMRVIGDEIDSQKRELERVVASHASAESALIEEKGKRPELGLIADALKTRLHMVGRL